jgi:protein-S-isoprenylcysteine O-methyltransferase Ste14
VFLRALVAFLALPGMVGFAVPLLIARGDGFHVVHGSAFALVAAGTCLLLWCVRDFYVSGRGTLAPWSPPTRLVMVGLYRYSRNPMYIAVSLILLGWALTFASPTLAIYLCIVMIAFHLRVIAFEEPWLVRTHGREYEEYRQKVRRWI